MDTLDNDIKRLILQSGGEEDKDVDSIETLARSITNLLCHKVSAAAYQRYSVRTSIVELLRNWTSLAGNLSLVSSLTDGDKSVKFVAKLLNEHLTDEILMGQQSVDPLLPLARALLDLSLKSKNRSCFTHNLDRVIDRLVCFDDVEKTEALLCSVVNDEPSRFLSFRTLEKIHILQKIRLIEKPLIEHFISCVKTNRRVSKEEYDKSIDQLLEYASKSPPIFQLLSSVLKELLARLEYSVIVIDYVESILKRITSKQNDSGVKNNILDLYPRKLRTSVILLRIDPAQHTQDSKEFTLMILKSMLVTNKDDILILLSHFPKWLNIFSNCCNMNSFDDHLDQMY